MGSFDIGKWVMKLMTTSHSYFTLLEFANDKHTFHSYTNQKVIYSSSNDTDELIELKMEESPHKEDFQKMISDEIDHALENYSNQLVVILATYIETMHSEFFQSLFNYNNKLIYDYLFSNNDNKDFNILNLIFDAESKDEIIEQLINKAKKNIVNGSLKKINERILKMTEYQIDKTIIDSIQLDILDNRNMIIHESKVIKIKDDEIKIYFKLTEKYLFELGNACKKCGSSYIDQANWLK
ncbi:MAG: hypothetical protein PHW18_07880 [Sulfuricurvum sp.]|uniref:hypothetical protein n=1 Tax=Sulfuricurvum sp. TaxID=2025608 RepID=UPI00260C1A5C|nr:hypothetical protein [Sulfuricurvum sp.]MDD2829475.1 hypothetical protein [Sulfuricurvum sp.]MDD4948442.1 hypothetical protein [Sulfuricurvum sp.]